MSNGSDDDDDDDDARKGRKGCDGGGLWYYNKAIVSYIHLITYIITLGLHRCVKSSYGSSLQVII